MSYLSLWKWSSRQSRKAYFLRLRKAWLFTTPFFIQEPVRPDTFFKSPGREAFAAYNTHVTESSFWLPIILLLGWASGAIVNYLADVLPANRKLVRPVCVSCGETIPLGNYLSWPRRCPNCGRDRGVRTRIVEIAAVVIFGWLWVSPPESTGFWIAAILVVYFGLIVVIDMEHHLILHPTSVFGALLGLGTGVFLHGFRSTAIGGAAGFGIMLLFYLFG